MYAYTLMYPHKHAYTLSTWTHTHLHVLAHTGVIKNKNEISNEIGEDAIWPKSLPLASSLCDQLMHSQARILFSGLHFAVASL